MQIYRSSQALLLAALGIAGCSENESGAGIESGVDIKHTVTRVSLDVVGTDVDGNEYEVSQLSVVVSNQSELVIMEAIDVTGPQLAVELALELPPADGYLISVAGMGTGSVDTNGDGTPDPVDVPCTGEAAFDVVDGSNPPLSLSLTCLVPGLDPEVGESTINGTYTFVRRGACGAVTGFVGPLVSDVGGGLVSVSATATEGAEVTWTVEPQTAGTFADASSAFTTFDCESVTAATITMRVVNEAEDCSDEVDFELECVGAGPLCGDDITQPGEECDGSDTPPGEECNPPSAPRPCRLVVCGDGLEEGSEACDDGNTVSEDGCSATCEIEECGDGIVQPPEECELGDIHPITGEACQLDCTFPPPDECECEECASEEAACDDPANGTLCRDVLACYADTACVEADSLDTTSCLCGSYDAIYCAGGQADGPCQSETRAAANPGGNPATVLNTLLRWTDDDFPLGDANLLVDCYRGACPVWCP